MSSHHVGLLAMLLVSMLGMGVHPMQKSFLESFSLRDTVYSLAYPGVDCSRQPGGGTIGTGASVRDEVDGVPVGYQLTSSRTESFGLEPGARAGFRPAEVLSLLRGAIEAQVRRHGLDVESREGTAGQEVRIAYRGAEQSGELVLRAREMGGFLDVDLRGSEKVGRLVDEDGG